MNKHYLGDSVYVQYENYTVTLTTENGIDITNTIILEAEILDNLNTYLQRMFRENRLGKQDK